MCLCFLNSCPESFTRATSPAGGRCPPAGDVAKPSRAGAAFLCHCFLRVHHPHCQHLQGLTGHHQGHRKGIAFIAGVFESLKNIGSFFKGFAIIPGVVVSLKGIADLFVTLKASAVFLKAFVIIAVSSSPSRATPTSSRPSRSPLPPSSSSASPLEAGIQPSSGSLQ